MIAKGQVIADRYKILKSIGEGGMANVYLAYDEILERNVAVKILRGDLANDEKFVRRFQREALSAASLSNENIVGVYDVGQDGTDYYIVMEYIEGKHLKNLLKKRGRLTLPEVIDIMLQVTSGLSVAHDSYIIHRDIKPQNIMILENGIVKLTDFGIAVAMNSTQLTQTNSVMGSVHYLPPEQASGKGATLQSDIYSLGILMYELLTGKLPFRGENAVEIALKHLKEKMPSIKDELPDIPASIDNIIRKATAKNPKNRYADAREMNEDLKTALEPARKNEELYQLSYPEELEDSKLLKMKKEEKITKKESEEVIAKQIKDGDLKDQNKLVVTLLAIFTGIVILITTIVILLPYINKSDQLKVPSVRNMTESAAAAVLQEAGFTIGKTTTEHSNSIEKDLVIKTSPAEGVKRKKGTEITLYVSLGNDEVIIEDYVNQNVDRIQGILETKGIRVVVEKQDVEDEDETDYDESTIIGQSIEKGTAITSGDTITLYVPNISNKYPNFTMGYSIEDIIDFAKEYKLVLTFRDNDGNNIAISTNNASDYEEYSIIKQNRTEGSKVTSGASLIIVLDYDQTQTCDGDLCE